MRKVLDLIWGVRKQKYFCKGDSTQNCPTGKSPRRREQIPLVSRTRCSVLRAAPQSRDPYVRWQGRPRISSAPRSLCSGGAMRGPECAAQHPVNGWRAGLCVHECWYRKTPSPLVGLIPIECVIGGKRPVAGSQAFERSLAPVFLLHDQRSFDQAVAPFRNLHGELQSLSRDGYHHYAHYRENYGKGGKK